MKEEVHEVDHGKVVGEDTSEQTRKQKLIKTESGPMRDHKGY